jgi:hypothetical protein
MKELRQKYFFNTRFFELTDSSLKCTISKPGSLVENEFTFEEIGTRTSRRKFVDMPVVIISMILVSIFIAMTYLRISGNTDIDIFVLLIFFVLAMAFVMLTLSRYRNDLNLYLNDGRYIAFYATQPDDTTVNQFLDTIKIAQKAYLLNRYATNEAYITDEAKAQRLYWLRDVHIIDETEFESLKNELLKKEYIAPVVGFNIKQDKL